MNLLNTDHVFLKPASVSQAKYDNDLKVNIGRGPMTKLEKSELVSVVQGLDKEELELVVDHIPVEMCFNRIAKELRRNKAFIDAVRGAVDGYEGVVE